MPDKIYYGDQTKKALDNFGHGGLTRDFIKAFAEVKKAVITAIQNLENRFNKDVYDSIIEAADLIISGKFDNQFILPFMQGSGGTSINMNFNEVLANLSSELYKHKTNKNIKIDPIEDINLYQSTNDVFPTAVTVMVYRHLLEIEKLVIGLQESLVKKETEYANILIAGRTEMQDAIPITMGQVFGAWAGSIERDRWRLNKLKERIRTIALGGTAVGTCFFAPKEYVFEAEKVLREITDLPLCRSQNLCDEISNQDKLSELACGYNILAENLFKISGDLLLYTSSFIHEIEQPKLQYGSTIMPAKTNPVILELVRGISIDVQGECGKISIYSQNGQLQLNAYLPFMVNCFINIHSLLKNAIIIFCEKFIENISINLNRIEKNISSSYVLLNILLPVLGYNKIKEIYKVIEKKKPETVAEFKKIIFDETELDEDFIEDYFESTNATSFLKRRK